MPHRRTIRYASPLLAWHELVLEVPADDWRGTYRADSPRLLVPGSGWVEAEQQGQRFICDALTPLLLSPAVPYRTRQPFAGQRSVLLVFEDMDIGLPGQACRLHFGPQAQWQLAACRAALDRGVQDDLQFEEAVLSLLPVVQDGARMDRAVERARELIASDPTLSVSVHAIARAVGTSPFHLARRFQRSHGIGLHRYRTGLRMALALGRLGDGERDLSALALDLGYSSHSHFTAAFGAHFGMPPRDARQLLAARAGIR